MLRFSFIPFHVKRVLTVVHRQDLAAVHLDEAAQRELRVFDAELLGPFKGESLQRHISTFKATDPLPDRGTQKQVSSCETD